MGPSHLGELINTAGRGTRARVAWTAGKPCGTSDTGPSHPGHLSTPWALGPGPELPEELVEPTGPQTLARVVQASW